MSCFNKINLLENCKERFICSICCDPKNNEYCKPFGTSVASQFLEHQQNYHDSVNEIECVYCCCLVPISNIIQHVQNHFLEVNDNNTQCPLCQESPLQNIRSIQAHMQSKHSNESLACPHCYGIFSSPDELENHLISSQIIMFDCPFPDCFVKTQSKVAILYHLTNKHSGSRCIKVVSQFTCAEHATPNQNCSCLSPPTNPAPICPVKASSILVVNHSDPQHISLPYSSRVLAKLSIGLDERLQEDLRSKMEQYCKFKVQLEVVDGQKQFVCSTCQYRSVHSLADVRKHILGCHCSVSTSYTRLCLRASRLDTNNLTLFSDRKLISFANEKLKKTENGSSWDGGNNCDASGLQLLDDSEQESGSTEESHVRSSKRPSLNSGHETSAKKVKLQSRQLHSNKMRSDSPIPEVGPPLERNENFDKVIQLNYSWPVLERLIVGQCPERYLPILKQKMDVYSQHLILLTRRNGKRYFLCSHCPNCSPHGMNDIRKHILGVHARLPERFKSAAMYCSRMNRDNYSLLSDEELLKKNQDMVRWRANPAVGQEDLTEVEYLPPFNRCMSPEECNNNEASNDSKSHNVFLSGDNGSPSPMTTVTESMNSHYQNVSQMSVTALFTSLLRNTSNTKHSHQSAESSPTSNATVNVNGKGRSRRSLVLKSKSTNHNCQSDPVNNII